MGNEGFGNGYSQLLPVYYLESVRWAWFEFSYFDFLCQKRGKYFVTLRVTMGGSLTDASIRGLQRKLFLWYQGKGEIALCKEMAMGRRFFKIILVDLYRCKCRQWSLSNSSFTCVCVRGWLWNGCGMQLSGNFVAATLALIYLKSTLKEAEVKVHISFHSMILKNCLIISSIQLMIATDITLLDISANHQSFIRLASV